MRRPLVLGTGFLSSALFLYIALRHVQFAKFKAAFEQATPAPVLAAFFVMLLIYAMRTTRWQVIIRSGGGTIRWWQSFRIMMIGLFGNHVLPARAGELVRAFLLRRETGASRSFALGTILVERVSGMFGLVILLVAALAFAPAQNGSTFGAKVRYVSLIALAVVVVGMVVLLWGRAWVIPLLRRLFGLVMPDRLAEVLASKFDRLSHGLEVLRAPRQLAVVIGLSLASWIGMVGVYALVFRAFHFALPFSVAALTVALVNLGILVPSSPGYVGTYEFFVVKSLGVFNIPAGTALAFGIVTRMLWYLFEVLVGFGCLWHAQLSVAQLSRIGKMEASPAGEDSERAHVAAEEE